MESRRRARATSPRAGRAGESSASECRGKSPAIVNHGGLESTRTCARGRIPGSFVEAAHPNDDDAAAHHEPRQARAAPAATRVGAARGLRRLVRAHLILAVREAEALARHEEVRGDRRAAGLAAPGSVPSAPESPRGGPFRRDSSPCGSRSAALRSPHPCRVAGMSPGRPGSDARTRFRGEAHRPGNRSQYVRIAAFTSSERPPAPPPSFSN